MALIICPECKKEVSDTCDNCIHCGYKLKQETIKKVEEPTKTESNNIAGKVIYYVAIFIITIIIFSIVMGIVTSIINDSDGNTFAIIISSIITGTANLLFTINSKYDDNKLLAIIVLAIALFLGSKLYLSTFDEKKSCSDTSYFIDKYKNDLFKNKHARYTSGCFAQTHSTLKDGNTIEVTCKYYISDISSASIGRKTYSCK